MDYIVRTLTEVYGIDIFYLNEFELYSHSDINNYKIIKHNDKQYQLVSFIKGQRCVKTRSRDGGHFVSFAHGGGDEWVYFNACNRSNITQKIQKNQINQLPHECPKDNFNTALGLYVEVRFIKDEFKNHKLIDVMSSASRPLSASRRPLSASRLPNTLPAIQQETEFNKKLHEIRDIRRNQFQSQSRPQLQPQPQPQPRSQSQSRPQLPPQSRPQLQPQLQPQPLPQSTHYSDAPKKRERANI